MDLGQYLNLQFKSAGVDMNNESVTALLSNDALKSLEIDDVVGAKVNGSILSLETAKAHPELIKHFKAQTLNGLDSKVKDLVSTLGISEEHAKTILEEKNSFEKIPMLINQVKTIEQAKASANAGDQAGLQKTIDELNAQILSVKQENEAQVNSVRSEYEGKMQGLMMDTVLGGFNYAMPVSKEANITTSKALLNQELAKKGLQVTNEMGVLSLKQAENGQDYFENNQKVGFNDFVNTVLGTHKMLKVSDGTPPPAPTTQPIQPTTGNSLAGVYDQMLADAQN